MKNWFEVKVRYDDINESGKSVVKNETYLVEAMDFSEAEDNSVVFLSQFNRTEIKVVSIKRSKISEMILGKGGEENYFEAKVKTEEVDADSGRSKQISMSVFVEATDLIKARELVEEFTSTWLVDTRITSIAESKIFSVIYCNEVPQIETKQPEK